LSGHRRRSNTQTESRPSFSASFPIYRTFSLVADSPVCGKTIPTFIRNTKENSATGVLKEFKNGSEDFGSCLLAVCFQVEKIWISIMSL
jgi:hypothetical protein